MSYNLGFISDYDLIEHVRETYLNYASSIDEAKFYRNKVDPVKLTFDSFVYGRSYDEVITAETNRQLDKTNTNLIGYFHQNIFKYISGWNVPLHGFDVESDDGVVVVEMKNKHNTMNSSSQRATYEKMQRHLNNHPNSICMLVEVIARQSQDIPWEYSGYSYNNIRRVSIDRFYQIVTGDPNAFYNLCQVLPSALELVAAQEGNVHIKNSVLDGGCGNLNGLFKSTFNDYLGF